MRCPDCDPITLCGFLRCPACGHVAYPADAGWMPGALILASYPAACEHVAAQAWLVDPAAMVPSPAWCNALAASTGAPCRNRPRAGAEFCAQHQPDRARP